MAKGPGEERPDAPERRTSGLRAAVDPETEEGRAFCQERIALFGKWFFVFTLAFYLVANLPLDLLIGQPFDWREEWFGPQELLTLGVLTVAAAMWLLARARPLSLTRLGLIEAVGVIGACALAGAMLVDLVLVDRELYHVFVVLLACANIVTVRAIVVPSSLRRTLVVSIVAFATPVALVVYTTVASPEISRVEAADLSIGALMWSTVAIASAAVTSRVLFQLRGTVRKMEKLGQYLLEQKLGEGGMGVVYRARHAMLRRPTAIKLLAPERNSELHLRRFEREVRRTAHLTHPNTIAVYDYGRTPAGIFYYAMELLDGITLRQLVDDDGPQPAARVVAILRQVCGALAEAHDEGLIHRDIKPANIMLCERGRMPDVVKVLDFGLVKELSAASPDPALSATDVVLGTPEYLSPEGIEAPGTVDGRSDLYAVGAVGYFLITGAPVFTASTIPSLCAKHLAARPVPPSERLGAPVPSVLEELLLSCLAKDPKDRPRDARTVAAALEACDCGEWSGDDARAWWRTYNGSSRPTGIRPVRPSERSMQVDLATRTVTGGVDSGADDTGATRDLTRRPRPRDNRGAEQP